MENNIFMTLLPSVSKVRDPMHSPTDALITILIHRQIDSNIYNFIAPLNSFTTVPSHFLLYAYYHFPYVNNALSVRKFPFCPNVHFTKQMLHFTDFLYTPQ